jgi:hypothetical protein
MRAGAAARSTSRSIAPPQPPERIRRVYAEYHNRYLHPNRLIANLSDEDGSANRIGVNRALLRRRRPRARGAADAGGIGRGGLLSAPPARPGWCPAAVPGFAPRPNVRTHHAQNAPPPATGTTSRSARSWRPSRRTGQSPSRGSSTRYRPSSRSWRRPRRRTGSSPRAATRASAAAG